MAGTLFTEVMDIFSLLQTDYRLITLYQVSPTHVEYIEYLTGFLVQGIEDFSPVCDQSLAYTLSTKTFTQTLTQKNINILAKFVKKYWLEKMIDNVAQVELKVQGDFKTFAEANNYSAKKEGYILELEKLSQILVEYGYRNQSNWDILNSINL